MFLSPKHLSIFINQISEHEVLKILDCRRFSSIFVYIPQQRWLRGLSPDKGSVQFAVQVPGWIGKVLKVPMHVFCGFWVVVIPEVGVVVLEIPVQVPGWFRRFRHGGVGGSGVGSRTGRPLSKLKLDRCSPR